MAYGAEVDKLNLLSRMLAYAIGLVYWFYISIPRFDVERRRSPRYKSALKIVKNIWIGSGTIMLVLIGAFPIAGVALAMAQALLTAFVCYMILDQVQ